MSRFIELPKTARVCCTCQYSPNELCNCTNLSGYEYGWLTHYSSCNLCANSNPSISFSLLRAWGFFFCLTELHTVLAACSMKDVLLVRPHFSLHNVSTAQSAGEECCRDCCYSTPFITLGTVCYITLSLLGFTISSIVGTVQLSSVPHLENG